MKLADFVSKLNMFLANAAEIAVALFIGEIIGWIIGGAIVAIVWTSVSLFFLARSYSSYAPVAAISYGVPILALVAWRALKLDSKDRRANRSIGKRRESASYGYRD